MCNEHAISVLDRLSLLHMLYQVSCGAAPCHEGMHVHGIKEIVYGVLLRCPMRPLQLRCMVTGCAAYAGCLAFPDKVRWR